MAKVIVTPNTEHPFNVRVIHPAYGDLLYRHLSEAELLQAVIARNKETGDLASDAEIHIVEASDLPRSGTDPSTPDLFDAWTLVDGKVEIDMARAETLGLI